jgi:hypothetical protein
MMGKALPFALILLAAAAFPLFCQEQEQVPEEYDKQEFSPFLRDLRRAEIIMLGTLPLTLFLSLEVYDFYRYADHDWDRAYAPWPFRAPGAEPYSRNENLGVFIGALSASLLIAVADYTVGKIKANRAGSRGASGGGRSKGREVESEP